MKPTVPGALHALLVNRQSRLELARKATKARRRQDIWTVEEIDLARRAGKLRMLQLELKGMFR